MKRYTQIAKRLFGVHLFGIRSRKHPSKQLHKSKIMSLAVAAMSVLTLGVGVTAAYAAVTTTKTGTDTTTNSTAQTQPGHSVRWVMSYGHSGSLGTVEMTDPIPAGTQFKPGSFVAPPGYTMSYSQNNGTSYGTVDPGIATTNLKAEGDAPATQTAVTSGLAQPPQAFNGAQGGGDGFDALFHGNNIYNVNHHTTNVGLNATLLQCHDKSGNNCPGFPTYATATAGEAFGTGDVNIGGAHVTKGGMTTDGRILAPVNHTITSNGSNIDSSGVMCYDVVNLESCGYVALDTTVGESNISGGALIGTKYYVSDDTGNVRCVDTSTPVITNCNITIPSAPGLAGTQGGDTSGNIQILEAWDDRYIFTNSLAANGSGHYVGCVDLTTNTTCANFPQTHTTGLNATFNIYMSPVKNASGATIGVCASTVGSTSGQRFECYYLDGSNSGSEAPWPREVTGDDVGYRGQGYGSPLSIGTKLYQLYSDDTGSHPATYTCWDFATNAACAGFTQSSSSTVVKPYSLRQDPFNPGCIWEVGDAGIFEVFDADTGSFNCSRSAAEVSAAPASFYCDGLPGHIQGWTNIKINNITGSQYGSAKITVRGVNGNPIVGYDNRDLTPAEQSSGIIDISALPVSGNTATLTAQITLFTPDGTPWSTNSPPYLQLTWDGDDIQFCFETTVTECSQLTAITNTASFLTADDEAPAGQTDTSTATLQSPGSTCTADVQVKKTVDKTTYNPGDTLTYTIEVTNDGPIAAENVSVTDDLTQILDDATYNGDAAVAGTGNVGYAAPTLSYTNPSLAAGATSTITFTVTTANPGTGNKSLPNKVVSNTGNCTTGSTDPDCATLTQGPNVTVTKTADKTTFNPGDTINYTLTVENSGAAPANVNLTDDLTNLLDDATYNNNATVTSGTGSVSYTAPNLTYTNATLGAGQTSTITFSVTTQSPGTGDKSMPNRVVSNLGNCTTGSTDPRCVTLTQGPNVDIVKSVDKTTFTPGETLNYTITVTNNGAAPANVSVNDNLSGILDDAAYNGDAAVTGGGSTSYTAPTLTYTNPSLGAGQTATITFSVTTANPGTGDKSMPNKVVSNLGNCVQGSTDPKCSTLSSGPNVTVTKVADKTTFTPGETINYTITVENTGAASANVNWTDDLSQLLDDATYNGDATSTGGAVGYSAPTLTYQNAALGAGQTDTITFSVTTNNPGTGNKNMPNTVVSNIGNCTAGSTDPKCKTSTTGPDVKVSKTADKTAYNPGDTINYTVTVRNEGAGPANVTVTDDMTGVLDDATYNNNAVVTGGGSASFVPPNLTYTNSNLGAGQTATITFSVTTNNPGVGDKKVENRVTSNLGNCTAGSTDPACVTVTNGPNVTYVKTVSKGSAVPGETLTYTITATNSGLAPATNLSYVDNLSPILDDATYNGDAVASNGGNVSFAGSTLTFTHPSLGAGQTSTATFTATLKKPVAGDQNLTNKIVSNSGNCQTGSTDPQCVATTFISDVHIKKEVDKTTFNPGDTITYTVTAENSGTAAATNFTLSDDLTDVLDDATYNNDAAVTGGGSASVTGNTLTYTNPSLGAGQTATITYSVTTTNPGTGNKDVHNKLQANFGNCQPGSTDPACGTHSLGPNVVFEKQADKTTVKPGDIVTYTITGTNNGKAPASNPSWTDNLSALLDDATYNNNATVVSGAGAVAYNSPNLTYQVPTMNVGDMVTITFTVTVNKPAPGDKVLTNTLVSTQGNCQQNSTDPKCKTVTNSSNIVSRKTTDVHTIKLGDTVTYTWTVTNDGTAPASGVEVIDDMTDVLDDATYNNDAAVTGGGNLSYAEPNITYTNASLAVGATATITYSLTINNPQTGDLKLDNMLRGHDTPPEGPNPGDPDDPCATPEPGAELLAVAEPIVCHYTKDIVPPTNLKVVKTTEKPSAYAGKNLAYTITYSNLPTDNNPNPSDAHNVKVTETVPEHTTFVASESDENWECSEDTTSTPAVTRCVLDIGDVPAGTSVDVPFVVKVDASFTGKVDSIKNEVEIEDNCASSCPPGGYEKFSKETPIGKIEMQKNAPTDPIAPGKSLTYTITATNVGTGPVTAYTITDDFKDVLDDATFNHDAKANLGTTYYTEPILTWTGDIPAGETLTLTYSVTVKPAGSGNGKIVNSIIDPEVISNCMTNSPDPKCTSVVGVSLAKTGESALWIVPAAIGLIAAGGLAGLARRQLSKR